MTQIFLQGRQIVPVTVIKAGPCTVIQKKTIPNDGYNALQLGFESTRLEKLTKPLQGHFKGLGGRGFSTLKEFKVQEVDQYEIGQDITTEIFNIGEKVVISGMSKGKGFAGVIKRWGFHGGPKSHGSMFHRAPGSIGASATPSRVVKGKKMPGHLGTKGTTVKNIEIVDIKVDENLLFLKGAVPGGYDGLITIRKI
jgi:large subunit ribosomal protein L3